MPKVVDPEERRDEITRAVMRVIERDGLAHVTLANVAAEARLAIGSVRHYTGTYQALLTITMQAVVDSISRRLVEHARPFLDPGGPQPDGEARRRGTLSILSELLPLDDRRRTETIVWLAFNEAARNDEELAGAAARAFAVTRQLIRQVLGHIATSTGATWSVEVETHRLAALLDGLAFNGVHRPETMTPELMTTVLRRHLDSLTPAPG